MENNLDIVAVIIGVFFLGVGLFAKRKSELGGTCKPKRDSRGRFTK